MVWRGQLQVRITLAEARTNPTRPANIQRITPDLLSLNLRWGTDSPINRYSRPLPTIATGTMVLSDHDGYYKLDNNGDGSEYLPPRKCRIWIGSDTAFNSYIWDGWAQMRPCGVADGPAAPVQFCLFDDIGWQAQVVHEYDFPTGTGTPFTDVLSQWHALNTRNSLLVDTSRVSVPAYKIGPITYEGQSLEFLRELTKIMDGYIWFDKDGKTGIREHADALAQANKANPTTAERALNVVAGDAVLQGWREAPMPAAVENRITPYTTLVLAETANWVISQGFTETPTAQVPSGYQQEWSTVLALPMNAIPSDSALTATVSAMTWQIAPGQQNAGRYTPEFTSISAMNAFFASQGVTVSEGWEYTGDGRSIRYYIRATHQVGFSYTLVGVRPTPIMKGTYRHYVTISDRMETQAGTPANSTSSQAVWGIREHYRQPWFYLRDIGVSAGQRNLTAELARKGSVEKMLVWEAPLWQDTQERSLAFATQIGVGAQHKVTLPGRTGGAVPVITLAQELHYRMGDVPYMRYYSHELG